MNTYRITVVNRITQEVVEQDIQASCFADAQVTLLTRMFREFGWRSAVALADPTGYQWADQARWHAAHAQQRWAAWKGTAEPWEERVPA